MKGTNCDAPCYVLVPVPLLLNSSYVQIISPPCFHTQKALYELCVKLKQLHVATFIQPHLVSCRSYGLDDRGSIPSWDRFFFFFFFFFGFIFPNLDSLFKMSRHWLGNTGHGRPGYVTWSVHTYWLERETLSAELLPKCFCRSFIWQPEWYALCSVAFPNVRNLNFA